MRRETAFLFRYGLTPKLMHDPTRLRRKADSLESDGALKLRVARLLRLRADSIERGDEVELAILAYDDARLPAAERGSTP